MKATPELPLAGCRPAPLAGYLKALGLLRLVATQADPAARGAWQGGQFILHTRLDKGDLLQFLLHEYRPTPVISPWNGGSGFHPKDNAEALLVIAQTTLPRLEPYRAAIGAARAALQDLGLGAKPNEKTKPALLALCRATLPEEALPWLDAAAVLGPGGPSYMPLLGTGGNDGRLDFSNNFMQQLLGCLGLSGDEPGRRHNLEQALFGAATATWRTRRPPWASSCPAAPAGLTPAPDSPGCRWSTPGITSWPWKAASVLPAPFPAASAPRPGARPPFPLQ